MHAHYTPLNVDEIIKAGPLRVGPRVITLMQIFILIGLLTTIYGFAVRPAGQIWVIYFVNLTFWMGLACGSVITSVIFQIVRAKWSIGIRRLGEAGVSFFPFAYCAFLVLYMGKEDLFVWANHPMPGRETWMSPNFVFLRFAILLPVLFFTLHRFVRHSLRGDVGLAREVVPDDPRYRGWQHALLTKNWQGSQKEVYSLQALMSYRAPLVILVYVLIISLWAFEMVMATDGIWYSNMYGGFSFCAHVYTAWCLLVMLTVYFSKTNATFSKGVTTQQTWDLGKLMFGFSMLWGYMWLAQFLPQWYANLPETTQWWILRARTHPWKDLGYVTLSCAFFIPWIMLLGREIKQTPKALVILAFVPWIGVWLEKYMVVMPTLSPKAVPFGITEIGMTLGFAGVFFLGIANFLKKYPMAIISSPLARLDNKW